MSLTVGEARRFDGVYFAHWEISHFKIETGRRFFGLVKETERCALVTGDDVEPLSGKLFPEGLPPNWRMSFGVRFAMSFDGRVLEHGRFGHAGWCHWRVRVLRWIHVARVR